MLPLKDEDRVRILSAVARKGPLYSVTRVAAMTASLLGLLAVPLLGIARVDLWGGNHVLLGEPATWFSAMKGVVVSIIALYAITFATNAFVGRFFCGWGCPVGFVSRLGESVDVRRKSRLLVAMHHVLGAAFVATFVGAVMLWWVDPRVVTEGSATARLVTAGVFALLWGGGFLHAFVWRFGFCLHACPIGLYYRLVTSKAPVGIVFDEVPDPCTQCGACVKICPVALDPRRLGEEQPGLDGDPETRFGDAECLRCGDCVAACSMVFSIRPGARPPLRFGRPGAVAGAAPAIVAPESKPENAPAPAAPSSTEHAGRPKLDAGASSQFHPQPEIDSRVPRADEHRAAAIRADAPGER